MKPLAVLAVAAVLVSLASPPALAAAPPERLSWQLRTRPLRGLQGPTATLLTTGTEGGSLPMAALAAPAGSPGPDGRIAVPFFVEIEGAGLLGERRADAQPVELYVYAMGVDGVVHDFVAQGLRLELAEWGEAVHTAGLKLAGSVSMPPGAGSLRILVFDPETLRYGLRVLPLTVPARDAAFLLPPFFADPRGRWVLAQIPGELFREMPGKAGAPADQGLLVDEGWGLPASLPVLASGQPRDVVLVGRGVPRDAAPTLVVREESGPGIWRLPLQGVDRASAGSLGLERLAGRIELPDLPTGRYRIAWTLAAATPIESPSLTALVVAEELPGEVAWAELRRLAGAAAQSSSLATPTQEIPRKGRKRDAALERLARQGYEEALRTLASGAPLEQVVRTLAEVEVAVLRQGDRDTLEDLREVETGTMDRLARAEPESLLPLVLLHTELYRHLRGQKEYLLAENARWNAAELAVRSADHGERAGLASQALLGIAADLVAAGARGAGQELLDRALTLDGGNEAVRLFLAACHEKDGDYPRAVEVLEPLLEAHPDSFEGRLRLAVNLRRTGREEEAEGHLRRLLAETSPEWVQVVAWQELTRALLNAGRDREAALLLRQALERWPHQQQLALQLAWVLRRQGAVEEARELLAGLRPKPDQAGKSPRHFYNQWPAAALEEPQRSLRQQALVRLSTLSRALAALPKRGDS